MRTLQWNQQKAGERLLRGWLGVTFTYAGVEKLADPGFFRSGSQTYIGTQLDGFAQGSPLGPVLHLLGHAPVLAGIAVATTEILVGVATLTGVGPLVAAGVGASLSVGLWLSASWHVHPYFLGSDSIYAVAWIAYGLSLPSAVLLLRAARERRRPTVVRPAAGRDIGQRTSRRTDEQRRQLLRGGVAVVLGLAVASLAALAGRARAFEATHPGGRPAVAGAGHGTVIAALRTLTARRSLNFTDPSVGKAVVVALPGGAVAAYSRTCTHAGCIVNYDQGAGLIACPCHGSRFDPAAHGAVVNGPAVTPLPEVAVRVDRADGTVRRA